MRSVIWILSLQQRKRLSSGSCALAKVSRSRYLTELLDTLKELIFEVASPDASDRGIDFRSAECLFPHLTE
jgi:hypothetical protein